MENKFIITEINEGIYVGAERETGSPVFEQPSPEWQVRPRLFDSAEEAERKLNRIIEDFPVSCENRIFKIETVYIFSQ
jgi:hypothetical protein